ncbi:putative amino acid transporter protein [Botrytis fragariae]|uniref:Putative amino acid transporter protein n=1 Tax=Botrytis fragariae TaxID=1964551 RepID=A0A8H6EJV2_9HELO|nr:putative amino acid transporter protein [Botrytis fragariae]KAF5874922.1 putative amino acid transporter protein [Botrytis fragariae]
MEKEHYNVDESSSPDYNGNHARAQFVDPSTGHATKAAGLQEAGELYGNIETAEEYGYVTRGLKSRHIQFIALGGTIGTGLFLGIGSALTQAGPLSMLLGYSITGIAIFAMMQCLGEMATWLPLPGAIPQFAARYVDDALGFAVGWNNWYSAAITLCAEISAAAVVIDYWPGAVHINVAAWISLIIVLVICLNIFAVSIYGEAEFIFASIKIVTIVGLLIMAFIVDLGGNPKHDRLGFRYWKHGQFMLQYDSTGDTGRFLGLFSTLVNAAFSYGGVELVAVAAGEAENPRKNIPKAVRRVFWRILFFYVLGSLAIGVLVSSSDTHLLKAQDEGAAGAARSPWVIGIQNAGIPVLPSIINAVILTSATSSANAFLYTGSRYLFALAQNKQAPRFLLRCSKAGVPYWAVLCTASISLITFLSVGSGGASTAFTWFQNLTTIASLFTWCSICVAYIKFHSALAAQGVDRNTLVFKSKFQPYTAWISLAFFVMIILFNGFDVFVGENHSHWNVTNFLTAYIGIPIFFLLYGFWKVFKRTKWIQSADADIYTGKAALDAEDDQWPDLEPRNIFEKIWFWIA